jgi:hypothetical protein
MLTMFSILLKFTFFLIILALIISLIYKFIKVLVIEFRENKIKSVLIKITTVVIVIFGFNYIINMRNGWNLSAVEEQDKKYAINFNEERSSGDTKIRINDVLIDFRKVAFNVAVKGRDKLVAVEVKKNLQDAQPLVAIQGLWLGKRFMYSYNAYSYSYNSEGFIDPIYIICYLSNGEEVSFKAEDTKNIKSLCKVIPLNKDFQKEGEKIRFRTFTKGATYGSLYMVSDLSFSATEVSVFIEGKEYKDLPYGGSGGQQNYSTPPIGDSKAYVKIRVKSSGKEYKVDIQ